MKRLKVLIWHVHGAYLYYLAHAPHDFYVLSKPDRGPGYSGKFGHIRWPDNVHDMPVAALDSERFDCVIYQLPEHYQRDRLELFSDVQLRLPAIYIEHDPPQRHPTDTRHYVADTDVMLVHVTHFNALMWDGGNAPTRVIEHGVVIPADVRYSGVLERGIVVINNLHSRGRRLGADIFARLRAELPLDLIGMEAELMGGIGEILHKDLCAYQARYRFFFNPIRYTSLGLAVIEAMMVGLPIVGLATTEMVTTIEDGVSGYLAPDVDYLRDAMRSLLADRDLARALGARARDYALERFNIGRFSADWDRLLREVAG